MLEERLKVVEGCSYDIGEAVNLCLVLDIEFPPKFKVPEFDKSKGTSCPKNHMTMYYRKMTLYARNDKLLIHCFQDSLIGVALNWYMHLERAYIRNDTKKPLYPDSTNFTRLSTVLRLFNLKAKNGWIDKNFTKLLKLLSDMLSEGNTLLTNNYDAKKILCPMDMNYKKSMCV
uniref:Retrotransposon gag domain-containing protein n=1 Tax=Cajanus cajan TaxID=3821 RepID=A0A151RGU4_CAJCA|nr:hypothetical protein KK1_036921 [Cajanus cajan]